MQLTITVIGAPHGLRSELRPDVRTDQPGQRPEIGAMLETDPQGAGSLTMARIREYRGAVYAMFSECADRTMVGRPRGVRLTVETDEDDYVEEDAFYEHELVGLEALDPEGYESGKIIGLEAFPVQDMPMVRRPDGDVVRVPSVYEIVTEVDLNDNCVVIRTPQGFFSTDDGTDGVDLNEESSDQREGAAEEG